MKPPAEFYTSKGRHYETGSPEVSYPGHYEVRRVRRSGEIKWQGRRLFVSQSLERQSVGLEQIDDGVWSLYFGSVLLGRYDERDRCLDLL